MTIAFDTPAILTGNPQPLITDPTLSLLGENERANLLRVFDQCAQRGGREADEVEEFENRFARKLGVEYAIATCSAIDGYILACEEFAYDSGRKFLCCRLRER